MRGQMKTDETEDLRTKESVPQTVALRQRVSPGDSKTLINAFTNEPVTVGGENE